MSKPLSILATLLLLIVPSLLSDRCSEPAAPVPSFVSDRCSKPGPPAPRCAIAADGGPAIEARPAPERAGPHRSVWAGPGKWIFVAQGVAISIVHRVVLDRAGVNE
jgi:hypothetical protein